MSLNGAGVFIVNSTGQPVVANTLISAAVFNAFTADVAAALSTAVYKDGQQAITADLPLNSHKLTGVAAGTARTDAATLANLQDLGTSIYVATVGGTADAITLTPVPAIPAYVAGQSFSFVAASSNTGATTVAVSGLAAKSITKRGTTALLAGDIAANAVIKIVYDGVRFQLVSTSTTIDSSGGTVAGDTVVSRSQAGGDVGLYVANLDNSNVNSHSRLQIQTGGSSGGDPKLVLLVPSATAWSVGIDNSDSDSLKIGASGDVGTNTFLTITTSGAVTFSGAITASNLNGTALVSGGALGTPSSGNLANCTGVVVNVLGTKQDSTSGVSRDFTGIPAGVKDIVVNFSGVSTNGSSVYLVQLGDSGGIETTGYNCFVSDRASESGSTAGFVMQTAASAGASYTGSITLSLLDPATNTWVGSGNLFTSGSNVGFFFSGSKALSGQLDRVRVTTVGGSDTFDAGMINIKYSS